MKPLLLISGMYQASWCWHAVRDRLAAAGHEVITPDLAGLAESDRHTKIDLETHIGQIIEIAAKSTYPLIACAHSYAGTVLMGAADRLPSRFAALVLLDANMPQDGCSVLDRYSPELRGKILARAVDAPGGAVLPPPPASALGLTHAADQGLFDALMRPQPLATLLQPVRLSGGWKSVPRKLAVTALQGPRGESLDTVCDDARRMGFECLTMPGGHQLMIEQPDAVAALLSGLAGAQA